MQFASLILALCLTAAAGLLGASAATAGGSAGPARFLDESGDLQAFVVAYKDTLPGQDSNAFVQPSKDEIAVALDGARAALDGDLARAAQTFDALGYDVLLFHDTATGGTYVILRERTPCGRCWGLFVLNRSPSARNIAVEAPHPLFDSFTPEFAVEAYVRMDAAEFLMAGAHRYANGRDSEVSDMARNPDSLFQRMHELLTDRDTQVLQYHGFAIVGHPGYPNIVLSNGSSDPQPEVFTLKAALEEAGETVGVYDGEHWADLGATVNPQGKYSRSIGGRFYHMEHVLAIRSDPARRSALVGAAIEALIEQAAPVGTGATVGPALPVIAARTGTAADPAVADMRRRTPALAGRVPLRALPSRLAA